MKLALTILSGMLLVGCGDESGKATASSPEMPRFSDEHLAKGRGVWMGTCRNCHLMGVSGAPAVTDQTAWAPRIEKGKSVLYLSATNGIQGAGEQYLMPPRGGNNRLSDEQVRQAVDYMLEAVAALGAGTDR